MADLLDVLDVITAADTVDAPPAHFHTSTRWSAQELEDAFEKRCTRAEVEEPKGILGVLIWSHMWHLSWGREPTPGRHSIITTCPCALTRCSFWEAVRATP